MTEKSCSRCHQVKLVEEFYLVADKKGGRRRASDCKACRRGRQLSYQTALPGGNRGRHMLRNYGITITDFTLMRIKQGDVCYLCKQPETAVHRSGNLRNLCIDHEHETGHVRHLLCSRCNFLVGHIEAAGSKLTFRAIQYIEDHRNRIYDEDD